VNNSKLSGQDRSYLDGWFDG